MQIDQVWDAVPEAIPQVRAWTRAVVSLEMPDDVIESAVLVVSELATNAIEHTPSAVFAVHLDSCAAAGLCVVAVSDQGSRSVPQPQPDSEGAEGGRGLALVEALAAALVVSGGSEGRTVAAVLTAAVPALEKEVTR